MIGKSGLDCPTPSIRQAVGELIRNGFTVWNIYPLKPLWLGAWLILELVRHPSSLWSHGD